MSALNSPPVRRSAAQMIVHVYNILGASGASAIYAGLDEWQRWRSIAPDRVCIRDWLIVADAPDMWPVSARRIMSVVCDHYRFPVADMLSARRTSSLVLPRQVAMYLTSKHSRLSYPQMGQAFHRDKSTVAHAVEQAKKKLRTDRRFAADVAALEGKLRAQA